MPEEAAQTTAGPSVKAGASQAIVTAVGVDKPGNLFHVAQDVSDAGCTILACSMTVLQARTAMILVIGVPASVSPDGLKEALDNSRAFGLHVEVRDLQPWQEHGLGGTRRASRNGGSRNLIPWHFSGQAADQRGMVASVTQVLVDAGIEITRAVARVISKVAILDIDVLIPEDMNAQFLPGRVAAALPARFAELLPQGVDRQLIDTLDSGLPAKTWTAPPIFIPGRHGVAYQQQWSGRWVGDFVITAMGEDALLSLNGIARDLLQIAGSIEAASVVVLQGRAALMLVVSAPHDDVKEADILQAVRATKQSLRLDLVCHDIRGPAPEQGHADYNIGQRWHIVGHVIEQPNVLCRVARVFAENDINICEASSDVIGTPPLCTIDLDVIVGRSVPFASVCRKYTELAAGLGFVKADLWQVEEP